MRVTIRDNRHYKPLHWALHSYPPSFASFLFLLARITKNAAGGMENPSQNFAAPDGRRRRVLAWLPTVQPPPAPRHAGPAARSIHPCVRRAAAPARRDRPPRHPRLPLIAIASYRPECPHFAMLGVLTHSTAHDGRGTGCCSRRFLPALPANASQPRRGRHFEVRPHCASVIFFIGDDSPAARQPHARFSNMKESPPPLLLAGAKQR